MLQDVNVSSGGISDPNHMLTDGDPASTQADGLEPASGILDMSQAKETKPSKNSGKNSSGRSRKKKTTSEDVTTDVVPTHGLADASDDELDMTGFVGSYDLPSRET
jgi:hypothetical protein